MYGNIKPNDLNQTYILMKEMKWKKNIQTLHIQRKIWKSHNKKSICWDFYCVNDDKGVDLGNP
jgi:hypothetical protein